MSILIKIKKEPKGCGQCPCSIYGVCDAAERHLGEYRWSADKRPKWCPIITVSGRLIDADKLTKKENLHIDTLADEWYVRLRDIEDAPIIIEAEIEKGGTEC